MRRTKPIVLAASTGLALVLGSVTAPLPKPVAQNAPTVSGDVVYEPLRSVGRRPPVVKRRAQVSRAQRKRVRRLGVEGIPDIALAAYRRAARGMGQRRPSCHLTWAMLAGIGLAESNHGSVADLTHRFTRDGTLVPTLVGRPLTGKHGTKAIHDTDDGRVDGDPNWDRAVGPMQFIPSTWAIYGVDGNSDSVRDVDNIFDATLAAGRLLCEGYRDLASPPHLAAALFSYNHSRRYVRDVLYVIALYSGVDAGWLISAAGPLAVVPPERNRRDRNRDDRRKNRRQDPRQEGQTEPRPQPSPHPNPAPATPTPPPPPGEEPMPLPSPPSAPS